MPNPPLYQAETTGPVDTARFNAFVAKLTWAQHGENLNYNGAGGRFLAVNTAETALEFAEVAVSTSKVTLSGTNIALGPSHRRYQPTTRGINLVYCELQSQGSNAVTITLPNSTSVGNAFLIAIPDAQTGTVTLGLQSGASFAESGVTSYTLATPSESGQFRWVEATCTANSSGSAAVYEVLGDVLPPSGEIFLGSVRLYASLGPTVDQHLVNRGFLRGYARPLRLTESTKTANYTLTDSDAGSVLYFNSSSAVTLTVPTNLQPGAFVPVFNIGSGTLTVQKSGGGSTTVANGECAVIVTGSGGAVRISKGTFTAL